MMLLSAEQIRIHLKHIFFFKKLQVDEKLKEEGKHTYSFIAGTLEARDYKCMYDYLDPVSMNVSAFAS